jgi:hypothetical protein
MTPADREESPRHEPPTPRGLGPCVVGETIRTLRVWGEEQWEALDPGSRPADAEHVPGLGWVSAGPVRPPPGPGPDPA